MPTQPPLPPLLTPYVSSLPQSSLVLLSSVLGATGNWLILRYMYAALSASSNPNASFGTDGLDNGKKRKVVLVSFLRGWEFWRSEAKRLVNVDVHSCYKRMVVTDGYRAWILRDSQTRVNSHSLMGYLNFSMLQQQLHQTLQLQQHLRHQPALSLLKQYCLFDPFRVLLDGHRHRRRNLSLGQEME